MAEAYVCVGSERVPLKIVVNGPDATFRIGTDRISGVMLAEPDDVSLDLLDIACVIFAADGMVRRGGPTRPEMGSGWRRRFDFDIPVRAPDVWSRDDVTEALVETVDFLMEDSATFRFRPRPRQVPRTPWLNFDPSGAAFHADEVILFSGGLDSFAGTLERLETSSDCLVLVTHRSAQKIIPHQVRLGEWLADRYGKRLLHIHVPAHRKGHEASETTQRSRSFLFAALAQIIARLLGCPRISFYENGIVSHNLPISAQVVGSMATRTTHPRSLRLIDKLHGLVLPEAAAIRNPYAGLTKTEVVQRIAQHGGQDMIKHSVSCTHVRDQDTLRTHCAACSQCLDRRFAIVAAGLANAEPPEMYRFDVLAGARKDERSRTLAVDWTRHAREVDGMDPMSFLSRFAQDIARVVDGYAETDAKDTARRMYDLHKRHAASVMSVLEKSFASHAGDLARQTLPPTSLLAQHIGSAPSDFTKPYGLPAQLVAPGVVDGEADEELSFGPTLPMHVQFFEDAKGRGIDIRHVTTVRGQQATIVHALRVPFEEDCMAQRPADEHRYRKGGEIAQEIGISKEAVRQDINRFRRHLQFEWKVITGTSLSREELIQSGRAGGYRLAPHTKTSSR